MTLDFAFKWRILDAWHEPDADWTFSRASSIFTWADIHNPSPSSPLGRFVDQLGEWGFNGLAFFADPEKHREAMGNFARYLKERGVGMIVRRDWSEIERGYSWPPTEYDGRPRSSRKLCPYDKVVRAYWADRIARDYQFMPDLLGYRVNATESWFQNGAPWMCHCPTCQGKTGQERTRDGIRLMAELLGAHGGTLFWEACQDNAWNQRQEAHFFRDLTDQIPENAFVFLKRYYWDFHPRWPRHPLYDTITVDAQGRSPYMTSIHATGEWRGLHDFPRSMVDDWSEAFRDMAATGQQGLWAMMIVHPDGWDRPLNRVKFHALARYMRDPYADPSEIKLSWAREEYGHEIAPVVVDVVDRVTEAARGMYEVDGMWVAKHSHFTTLEYMDSHLCGPYDFSQRLAGMMGLGLPLDMYSPERQAEIRANPDTRIVFNHVPITPRLKAELMAQKDGAVRLMEEAISLWRSLEGKMDEDMYGRILGGLMANRNDAILFRHVMDLYMDWKLGVLTEAKIDAVLAACRGLVGIVFPDPMSEDPGETVSFVDAESVATFAEKLRRELREPWLEQYWVDHPWGEGSAGQSSSPELMEPLV